MGRPKTIAEKILSAHAKKDVRAGDIAICDVDFCFGQDGTSSIIIDSFKRLNVKNPKNRKRFAMVIDHSAPSPNVGVSEIHKKMRTFAKQFNLLLYDVGDGVCHQVIPEGGNVVAGDLVLGADSHTCTYGALNAFSTGVGSTDLAITLASGKNWFKVPETIKIVTKGRIPKGIYSKDIILFIIGKLGANGCTYKSVEFTGPVIKKLSMDARLTICNMAVEMGAKCGLMEADQKTSAWLKKHSRRKPSPVRADKNAVYERIIEFDISRLRPQIARPHTVDNVVAIDKVKGKKVDEVFIGTCANGRLEDLEIAARILKGRKIHSDIRLIVAPVSRSIYMKAVKMRLIDIFIKANGIVIAPGCGPCVGTHEGIPADGEVVLSTANRNFKGRMGNENAFIYLASPATCAASAIYGKITDPRKIIK